MKKKRLTDEEISQRWLEPSHIGVRRAIGPRLSPREVQIVSLIASGLSNKGVALHLEISEATVAAHLRRVFAKLAVNSRAAMVYQFALMTSEAEL